MPSKMILRRAAGIAKTSLVSISAMASTLLYCGAAALVLVPVAVALMGSPFALLSLLCLPLPLAFAIKYGAMAATLKTQTLVTPAAYCKRLVGGAA